MTDQDTQDTEPDLLTPYEARKRLVEDGWPRPETE